MCGMSEQEMEIHVPPHPNVWQPTRRQVLVVTVIVGILYAFAVNNQWRFGTDSALYLSLGRSLARGEGFVVHGGQGLPGGSPGLPIMIAICFKLFGEVLWPVNLMISAMGFLSAVLVYRIVRFDRSRRLALNVFLLTSLSVALYVRSLSVESDVPALFFMMAALWCLQKFTRGPWRYLPVAVVMLLGLIGTRMVGAVMVAALALGLLIERCRLPQWKKWVGAAAVMLPLVAMGLAALVLGRHASAAGGYGQAILGRLTEHVHWAQFYGYALNSLPSNCFRLLTGQTLPPIYSTPIILLMAYGAVRLLRQGRALIVLPVIVYVVMLVVLWGEPAARYLELAMPLMVYLFVDGAQALAAVVLSVWRREHNAPVYASIIIAVFLAANLPKTIREGLYKAHHPRFAEITEHGALARWQPVTDFLGRQTLADDEVILTPEGAVVHWLSDRETVDALDAPDTALGSWRLTRDTIGGRVVRFVVVPRNCQESGFFYFLKHLNRRRWTAPALTTEHFEVYDCPRGTFIYPPEDYPVLWR
ncbi:MAG: glycosyltransferase family 39 protein [Planctomycetes bacterium]|nr:glycosyltransferase family 39 protein [Planctomycetota bacterium]